MAVCDAMLCDAAVVGPNQVFVRHHKNECCGYWFDHSICHKPDMAKCIYAHITREEYSKLMADVNESLRKHDQFSNCVAMTCLVGSGGLCFGPMCYAYCKMETNVRNDVAEMPLVKELNARGIQLQWFNGSLKMGGMLFTLPKTQTLVKSSMMETSEVDEPVKQLTMDMPEEGQEVVKQMMIELPERQEPVFLMTMEMPESQEFDGSTTPQSHVATTPRIPPEAPSTPIATTPLPTTQLARHEIDVQEDCDMNSLDGNETQTSF